MVCKFRRYNRAEYNNNRVIIEDFTCDQVRELKDQWIAEFKKKNLSDFVIASMGNDPSLDIYVEDIFRFLGKCKCEKGS